MKNRIRALRKSRGWTLADLAERIQPDPPTPQTIARLETGTRTLSITWLEKIASALGVNPQELLTLSKGPTSPVIASVHAAGLEPIAKPLEVDLTVIAEDPVAITFEHVCGRYGHSDTLVFDRLEDPKLVFLDEALVKTPSGDLLYGSLFPKTPNRSAVIVSPPPQASLHEIEAPVWVARAVCLIRRVDLL